MKKIIYSLLAVSFLLSCNSSEQNPGKLVSPADSLQSLLQTVRDSIAAFPGEARLKYNLAVVLQDAGRYKEALAALDSMNLEGPDLNNPQVYFAYLYKKSELQELSQDTAAAINTLELLVTHGEITQAALRLANLYALTRNEKVLPLLQAMDKSDTLGNVAEISYFRGIYYGEKKMYKQAIAEFDKSIKKSYTFLNAYLEKGIALYHLKEYQKAMTVFELAITVSNNFPDAFYWKGRCQEAMGQTAEAKLNYQRAYGLDNTFTEAKEAADKLP